MARFGLVRPRRVEAVELEAAAECPVEVFCWRNAAAASETPAAERREEGETRLKAE
jgi:hypothetical protein